LAGASAGVDTAAGGAGVCELFHHHRPPPINTTITPAIAMMMRVCIDDLSSSKNGRAALWRLRASASCHEIHYHFPLFEGRHDAH
jgi:hypothetical protein